MKRLALVLASFLGTGCFIFPDGSDPGSVNIYWDFIRTAPAQQGGVLVYDDGDVGTADGACPESAVDFVTVDSPVGPVTVDCVYGGVQGVGLDGIAEGTRQFRVTGWRRLSGVDVAVYDETFDLQVSGNAVTNHFVDVHGTFAPLDLYAYLAFGVPPTVSDYLTCGEATPFLRTDTVPPILSSAPPNLDVEIRDVLLGPNAPGNLVEHVLVGCGDPTAALPARVFARDLDLDDYTVRVRGLRVEDDAVVFDSCRQPLAHFAAQTGLPRPEAATGITALTQPVPACP